MKFEKTLLDKCMDIINSWYCKNATVEANPNGQASDFITTFDYLFRN